MSTLCPECGGRKDRRAILCRVCKDTEPLEKLCHRCNQILPIIAFRFRSGIRRHRRRATCHECNKRLSREYMRANPEKRRAIKQRAMAKHGERYRQLSRIANWRKLWIRRGFDPDEVEKFRQKHKGFCDICGEPSTELEKLVVDHQHNTLLLRGMLCSKCNLALGLFADNPLILKSAIKYLKRAQKKLSVKG